MSNNERGCGIWKCFIRKPELISMHLVNIPGSLSDTEFMSQTKSEVKAKGWDVLVHLYLQMRCRMGRLWVLRAVCANDTSVA